MLELLKLELRKNPMGLPVKTIVFVMLLILLTIMIERNDPLAIDLIFSSYRGTSSFIKTLSQTVIMIFAAVQIDRIILREYHSKTINQLFSYPISRERIAASKILLIGSWTLISILFSNTVITCAALILNSYYPFIRSELPANFLSDLALRMLIEGIACTLISFIPLAFGMLRRSSLTLIVTAIMIAITINSHNGEFSATELLPIQIIGGLLGLSIIGVFIWQVGHRDLS